MKSGLNWFFRGLAIAVMALVSGILDLYEVVDFFASTVIFALICTYYVLIRYKSLNDDRYFFVAIMLPTAMFICVAMFELKFRPFVAEHLGIASEDVRGVYYISSDGDSLMVAGADKNDIHITFGGKTLSGRVKGAAIHLGNGDVLLYEENDFDNPDTDAFENRIRCETIRGTIEGRGVRAEACKKYHYEEDNLPIDVGGGGTI